MKNWIYKKLGEVCEIYQPKTISTEMLCSDGEYLVYGANGVIGRYNKYNHQDSEVLLTCRGATCGTINISEPFSWINGNAMVIHPNDESHISRTFLVYLMKSIDYSMVITGAAQPQITRQKLSPIRVPIPPFTEQERIVSELDLLQSIIEKQKAQLKEYDQLAQSIFYDMFGDPVTNEKGWKLKKMGEVCAQKSKIARASKKFTSNSPIEYIDISSVDNISKTITTTTSYIFSEAPSRAQQIVEYGDILISLVRPNLQNIAIVLYNKNNLVGSSGFCVIRTEQQTIKEYLFYVIRSSHFTDFLMQRVSGANYPAVREEDVKSFTLPIPPLSLQQQFASKIESIEKQKSLVQQSIVETQTMFDYTMDKYFG